MQVHWKRERLEFLMQWLPLMENEVDKGNEDYRDYMSLYREMQSLSKEFDDASK